MREQIPAVAEAGAPNVIVLAGGRAGLTDEEGMENCRLFLNNIKTLAEDKGVTICLELLNSKVDHPGYMCDRTAWASNCASGWRRPGSSCSTTSTTCRSWRAM